LKARHEYTLRTLGPDEAGRWDAFVRTSPHGTVFSRTAYLDALDVRREIVVIEREQSIEAGIVLARNGAGLLTNPLLVKHLGAMVRPLRGARARRYSHEKRLIERIAEYTGKMASFDYNFSPHFDNWLPYFWRGYRQQTRYTYRLQPAVNSDWRREGDAQMRNDLRNAERAGVVVESGATVDAIVRCLAATYRRQGARTPMSVRSIERFVAHGRTSGILETFAARDASGDIVAIASIAYDERCAYLVLNGMQQTAPRGANTLVIASAIDWTLVRGLCFDFEGSMIEAIERYYRGFGAERMPYYRIWRGGPVQFAANAARDLAKRVLGYRR
jgi:hypothetical protein